MNECCFKDNSMGLKVHTNSKMIQRFPRYRQVATPWSLGTRQVATPRFVSYQSEIFTDFRKLCDLQFLKIDSFKIDPWRTYVKIKVKKLLPGPLDTWESRLPSVQSKMAHGHL